MMINMTALLENVEVCNAEEVYSLMYVDTSV